MNQLSNVHLLSDEVAHNLDSNLKQQRIEHVSQTANKPAEEKENIIHMNPSQTNQNQENHMPPQNQQGGTNDSDFDEDDYGRYVQQQSNFENKNKMGSKSENAKDNKSNKILGMPKPLFWFGLAALAGVTGYFAYRYFKNKGGKSVKISKPSVSEVTEAASEAVKNTATNVATASATTVPNPVNVTKL